MKLKLQIGLLGIVVGLLAASGCGQEGSGPSVTGSSLSSADSGLNSGDTPGDASAGRGGWGGGGNGGGGNGGGGGGCQGGGGNGGGGGGNGGGGGGYGGGGGNGGGDGDHSGGGGGGGCEGDHNGGGGNGDDDGCGAGNSTGFGYSCEDATCFLQLDLDGCNGPDFHRWGWTNGAIGQGHHIFDLYAGAGQCDLTKGTLVGQVLVDYQGSTVDVTYDLCGPYGLAAVHVYVGNDVLPKKNGKYTVAPGKYPYKAENLAGAQDHVATFQGVSGLVYVVAHAEVTGDLAQGDCGERGCVSPCDAGFHPEVLDDALPISFVIMRLRAQGNNPLYGIDDAYFQGGLANAGIFSSPSGVFDHPTWCVDIDHDINSTTDSLTMVSSYDPDGALLACLVEHPENLDAVNWLLNQDPAQWGADQRDIQAALWALLEDNFTFCAGANCSFGGITYNKARVQAIVADALALGEGFVPPCDGVVGILLDPGCTIGKPVRDQVCIMEFPVGLVPGLCTECPPGE